MALPVWHERQGAWGEKRFKMGLAAGTGTVLAATAAQMGKMGDCRIPFKNRYLSARDKPGDG